MTRMRSVFRARETGVVDMDAIRAATEGLAYGERRYQLTAAAFSQAWLDIEAGRPWRSAFAQAARDARAAPGPVACRPLDRGSGAGGTDRRRPGDRHHGRPRRRIALEIARRLDRDKCDTDDTMPDELSPQEVARRLGTTTRSVQRWIAGVELPARRVGGRWRVAADAIDAFASPPSGRFVAACRASSICTLFIANRGEIAASDRPDVQAPRLCAHRRPPTVLTRSTCSTPPPSSRPLAPCGRRPPWLRVPRRARRVRPDRSIAAGLRWVGPPPAAIRAMGDKAAARRLAADARCAGPPRLRRRRPDASARPAAAEIGFPLPRQARRRRRRQGHAHRPRPAAARCARGRPSRGDGRLR